MNMLCITVFFVGYMVSDIPRVSVFEHCPYSVTFPYYRRIPTAITNDYYCISLHVFLYIIDRL